jgi:fimbrial chaperone protein
MRLLLSSSVKLASFLLFALASCGAQAMTVAPLILELSSGVSNRTAEIVVRNENASATSIEIETFRVELDENGSQRRTSVENDFLVFPPARMIKPFGAQVFKIQWVGAPLAKSQTYIFAVNQLPVAMPETKSGFQLVFNFEVIANIAPPSGTRSLDVLSSEVISQGGKRFPSLLLSNTGNVHARLSEATLTLRSGNWSKVLMPGELQQRLGVAVVQPGKKRRFTINVELPQNAAQVTAEISYEKALR